MTIIIIGPNATGKTKHAAVTTARLAVGLPPHAPSIAERFTR